MGRIRGLLALEYGKNDFAERFKILPDTHLKIILLDHQNNFVENNEQCCEKF